MSIKLLKLAAKRFDQIPDTYHQVTLTVIDESGSYGFQQSDKTKAALLNFIINSVSITEQCVINASNLTNVMNNMAREPFGVLIHTPDETLAKEILALNEYKKQKKIDELRVRAGGPAIANSLAEPLLFGWKMNDHFDNKLDTIIKHCSFISIWPQYWGEYGEHCVICTRDMKLFDEHLARVGPISESVIGRMQ